MELPEILEIPPFSLDRSQKEQLLSNSLTKLSRHHYNNCMPFRKMMDSIEFDVHKDYSYYELPFLPVRLFKLFELYSVPKTEIVKTMTSSATTGQAVSRIFLDKETSVFQTKALTKIVSSFIKIQRGPMIIIDSESVLKDRNLFSARGAGILGFSIFGSTRIFALNDKMELDLDKIKNFLQDQKGKRIFVFGFTFMIYQYFIKQLIENNIKIDLSDSVLVHGGGWKKLANEAISSAAFRNLLKETCNLTSVHDYYGMVEQTGTIYLECERGHLHTPIFSDVIIRRAKDFSVAEMGETGIIQVVSILPHSYPGHSLLTEDEGFILGVDDCSCGRKGKYFHIVGRLKNAEIRGCSDTYGTKIN
jgi:phenylacetate-coenzyme A ligase PaaK-like adenylate-forming protein